MEDLQNLYLKHNFNKNIAFLITRYSNHDLGLNDFSLIHKQRRSIYDSNCENGEVTELSSKRMKFRNFVLWEVGSTTIQLCNV